MEQKAFRNFVRAKAKEQNKLVLQFQIEKFHFQILANAVIFRALIAIGAMSFVGSEITAGLVLMTAYRVFALLEFALKSFNAPFEVYLLGSLYSQT